MGRVSVWGRVLDADEVAPPRSVIYWLDGDHKGPARPLDLHPVAETDVTGKFCALSLPVGVCMLAADCEAYGAGNQGARSSGAMSVTVPLPEGDIAGSDDSEPAQFHLRHARLPWLHLPPAPDPAS